MIYSFVMIVKKTRDEAKPGVATKTKVAGVNVAAKLADRQRRLRRKKEELISAVPCRNQPSRSAANNKRPMSASGEAESQPHGVDTKDQGEVVCMYVCMYYF
jgi:hypothetical protein